MNPLAKYALTWATLCLAFAGSLLRPSVAQAAPTLNWMTFLGGAGDDNQISSMQSVATDSSGNGYVVGMANATWSGATIVRAYSAGNDAFVAKVGPSGNLIFV